LENLRLIGKKLPPLPAEVLPTVPDWEHCDPSFIRRALKAALARPDHGWYVLDGSRTITAQPRLFQVDGKELVAYRADGKVIVAGNACPHYGGPLAAGHMHDGKLVCPWHGLQLDERGHRHWQPLPVHDDGVLTWVKLGAGPDATAQPVLPPRPTNFIDAVIRHEGDCEASDVIANRLDPWHGAHYHPHTFARLVVTKIEIEELRVRVAYRVWRRWCVEVDATFHVPDPRTIVMTIVDGEGVGSVVETHSTPIAPGRSAVIEATLASSERPGFARAQKAAWLVRAFMKRAARRLWVEDLAYAERQRRLREGLVGS